MPLPDAKPRPTTPTVPHRPDARPASAVGRQSPAAPSAAPPAGDVAAARHVKVGDGSDGQRLDNYLLGRLKGVPKATVHRLIRTGQVRVNGKRRASDDRVLPGDDVRIPPMRMPDTQAAAPARPLAAGEISIVYEDDALIVIDKPAGLAVHGGSGIAAGLIERLRASRAPSAFLELAHRLDRETSGLLLVAKRRSALLSLHRQMAGGGIAKHYRAIVAGRWARPGATRLRFALRRLETANGDRRVIVDPSGQPSETIVRLVAHVDIARPGLPPWVSVLDCELATGRTHQIRVHLTHAGFPILGDQKYGDFALNRRFERLGHRRMFLHAFSLAFDHPADASRLRFESPDPTGFAGLVDDVHARADMRRPSP